MFSRTHDLEQPGINKFLGALRQLGVHGKELSGRAVQEAYGSPLPPKGNAAAAARLAAFRGRVPAGVDDDDDEYEQGPQADEEPFVTPVSQRPRTLAAAAAPLAHAAKSGQYKSLLSIAAEANAAKKASSSSVSSPAAAADAASSSSGK